MTCLLNIKLIEASLLLFGLVSYFNTLRSRQNGRYFADDIFECIFLNENVWIPIKIPVKFVPKGPINNIPALFQIMAWRRPGDKPLSETVMVTLLTHICVTRPQWVKVDKMLAFDWLIPWRLLLCIKQAPAQRPDTLWWVPTSAMWLTSITLTAFYWVIVLLQLLN